MTSRPTHRELIDLGAAQERARIRRALVRADPLARVLNETDEQYVADVIDGFSPRDAAMMAETDDWMATPEQLARRAELANPGLDEAGMARLQELAEGFEEYETDPERATQRALDQLYGSGD